MINPFRSRYDFLSSLNFCAPKNPSLYFHYTSLCHFSHLKAQLPFPANGYNCYELCILVLNSYIAPPQFTSGAPLD